MTAAVFAEWIAAEAAEAGWSRTDVEAIVATLFAEESANLVRLARFFVDERDAAEDLVQEAFIRLARSAHRISDPNKAASYLRSIVLNLARDHNRRGLVSLRHRMRTDRLEPTMGPDEEWELREDQRRVIEALRDLAPQQRNCLVLRYYLDLSNPEIAATLGISVNTVKTHLLRGMSALESALEEVP